eukprot:g13817.t1
MAKPAGGRPFSVLRLTRQQIAEWLEALDAHLHSLVKNKNDPRNEKVLGYQLLFPLDEAQVFWALAEAVRLARDVARGLEQQLQDQRPQLLKSRLSDASVRGFGEALHQTTLWAWLNLKKDGVRELPFDRIARLEFLRFARARGGVGLERDPDEESGSETTRPVRDVATSTSIGVEQQKQELEAALHADWLHPVHDLPMHLEITFSAESLLQCLEKEKGRVKTSPLTIAPTCFVLVSFPLQLVRDMSLQTAYLSDSTATAAVGNKRLQKIAMVPKAMWFLEKAIHLPQKKTRGFAYLVAERERPSAADDEEKTIAGRADDILRHWAEERAVGEEEAAGRYTHRFVVAASLLESALISGNSGGAPTTHVLRTLDFEVFGTPEDENDYGTSSTSTAGEGKGNAHAGAGGTTTSGSAPAAPTTASAGDVGNGFIAWWRKRGLVQGVRDVGASVGARVVDTTKSVYRSAKASALANSNRANDMAGNVALVAGEAILAKMKEWAGTEATQQALYSSVKGGQEPSGSGGARGGGRSTSTAAGAEAGDKDPLWRNFWASLNTHLAQSPVELFAGGVRVEGLRLGPPLGRAAGSFDSAGRFGARLEGSFKYNSVSATVGSTGGALKPPLREVHLYRVDLPPFVFQKGTKIYLQRELLYQLALKTLAEQKAKKNIGGDGGGDPQGEQKKQEKFSAEVLDYAVRQFLGPEAEGSQLVDVRLPETIELVVDKDLQESALALEGIALEVGFDQKLDDSTATVLQHLGEAVRDVVAVDGPPQRSQEDTTTSGSSSLSPRPQLVSVGVELGPGFVLMLRNWVAALLRLVNMPVTSDMVSWIMWFAMPTLTKLVPELLMKERGDNYKQQAKAAKEKAAGDCASDADADEASEPKIGPTLGINFLLLARGQLLSRTPICTICGPYGIVCRRSAMAATATHAEKTVGGAPAAALVKELIATHAGTVGGAAAVLKAMSDPEAFGLGGAAAATALMINWSLGRSNFLFESEEDMARRYCTRITLWLDTALGAEVVGAGRGRDEVDEKDEKQKERPSPEDKALAGLLSFPWLSNMRFEMVTSVTTTYTPAPYESLSQVVALQKAAPVLTEDQIELSNGGATSADFRALPTLFLSLLHDCVASSKRKLRAAYEKTVANKADRALVATGLELGFLFFRRMEVAVEWRAPVDAVSHYVPHRAVGGGKLVHAFTGGTNENYVGREIEAAPYLTVTHEAGPPEQKAEAPAAEEKMMKMNGMVGLRIPSVVGVTFREREPNNWRNFIEKEIWDVLTTGHSAAKAPQSSTSFLEVERTTKTSRRRAGAEVQPGVGLESKTRASVVSALAGVFSSSSALGGGVMRMMKEQISAWLQFVYPHAADLLRAVRRWLSPTLLAGLGMRKALYAKLFEGDGSEVFGWKAFGLKAFEHGLGARRSDFVARITSSFGGRKRQGEDPENEHVSLLRFVERSMIVPAIQFFYGIVGPTKNEQPVAPAGDERRVERLINKPNPLARNDGFWWHPFSESGAPVYSDESAASSSAGKFFVLPPNAVSSLGRASAEGEVDRVFVGKVVPIGSPPKTARLVAAASEGGVVGAEKISGAPVVFMLVLPRLLLTQSKPRC